jgi:hypothetical protein
MPKKKLEIDSPPKEKLEALKGAAEYFNSDFTSLVCRDEKGKLLSVSVYATGKEAAALVRWLDGKDRKKEPLTSERQPEDAGVPSKSSSTGRGQKKGSAV